MVRSTPGPLTARARGSTDVGDGAARWIEQVEAAWPDLEPVPGGRTFVIETHHDVIAAEVDLGEYVATVVFNRHDHARQSRSGYDFPVFGAYAYGDKSVSGPGGHRQ